MKQTAPNSAGLLSLLHVRLSDPCTLPCTLPSLVHHAQHLCDVDEEALAVLVRHEHTVVMPHLLDWILRGSLDPAVELTRNFAGVSQAPSFTSPEAWQEANEQIDRFMADTGEAGEMQKPKPTGLRPQTFTRFVFGIVGA